MKSKIIKVICILLAFLCLGLGILGVILPVLPTTPFLLLASYLFAKGSDKFHNWFISTKLYENHLAEFVRTRAMTLKRKLCILLPVSTMLITTFILIKSKPVRILIPLVIIFKYYYFIFHIATIKKNEVKIEQGVIVNEEYSKERKK